MDNDEGNSKKHSFLCRFTVLSALIWALMLSFIAGGIYYMLPEDADLVIVQFTHPLPMRTWIHPPPARVVVAMATVGGRVEYLPRSLPTILNQTWKVDQHIISITKCDIEAVLKQLDAFGPFAKVPGAAAGNRSHGVIMASETIPSLTLQFLDQDWGPGTKIVGAYLAVGSREDTVIVTVDDDCGYDPTTVETLVRHMPADRGAVGGLCQEPRGTSGTGEWRRIDQTVVYKYAYIKLGIQGYAIECQGCLMAFSGAAYWANSFNDTLLSFLELIPPACFYTDDVWISGLLYQQGIKRYNYFKAPHPDHFAKHPNLSISSIPNTRDRHMWPCAKHFDFFRPT